MSQAPLLLHVFPSFAVGGAQVRFAAIANRFGRRWRHAVVALDGNVSCAQRLSAEVPLQLVPAPYARSDDTLKRLRAILSLLRRLRPDLLITSNWGSMEWAMANLLARVPHLHTEDGFGPEERARQLPRRVWTRRLVLRGSTVVLPSVTLERVALEQWRLQARNVRRIHNGIDLERFSPVGKPAVLDVPGEGPLIGTAAALRPEKNIARLLQALALLRRQGLPARLAIVGDGPERPSLEALTVELGIDGCTRFLGHVADPAAAYRAFDLFALSSDTEQMPFSVLEAMGSGLPIAATDVGDVRAMLSDENEPFVTVPATAPLAEALAGLVSNPGLRRRVGQTNRDVAELRYDQEIMFQSHAALMNQ